MVNDVFGFQEEPFGISPDPRFVHLDPQRQRAYEGLLSFLKQGESFVLLTGTRGLGKTVLIRYLAQQLELMHQIVEIFSCQQIPAADELQNLFSAQIGYSPRTPERNLIRRGSSHTKRESLQSGNSGALLLDDADNLDVDTIKGLNVWSRELVTQGFQLSIVLAGPADCVQRLREAGLWTKKRQPSALIRLAPLKIDDVKSFITHRLAVAGYDGPEIFTPKAILAIANGSNGNPQAINRFCRAALVIAGSQSSRTVSEDMVEQVTPGGLDTRATEEILSVSQFFETGFAVDTKGVRLQRSNGQANIPHAVGTSSRTPSDIGTSNANEPKHTTTESQEHIISLAPQDGETPLVPFHAEGETNDAAWGIITSRGQNKIEKYIPDQEYRHGKFFHYAKQYSWIPIITIFLFVSGLFYFIQTGKLGEFLAIIKEPPIANLSKQKDELANLASPHLPNQTPAGWVEPPLEPSSPPAALSAPRTSAEDSRARTFGQNQERNEDGRIEYLNVDAQNSAETKIPRSLEHRGNIELGETVIAAPSAREIAVVEPLTNVPSSAAIHGYDTASGTTKELPAADFDEGKQTSSLDEDRTNRPGETITSATSTGGAQKVLLNGSEPPSVAGEHASKEGPAEITMLPGSQQTAAAEPGAAQGSRSPESRHGLEPQDGSIGPPDIDQLLARADQLVKLDDVASARLVYRLAALHGSAAAATALASTYDPVYLSKFGNQEIQPDPAQAIEWYRKAVDLGDQMALVKLGDLATWLQQEAARETARPQQSDQPIRE